MSILKEIEEFAEERDKPVLRWLIERYHMRSKWAFVTTCTHERYGELSYQTNRVWRPTWEGRVLYAHAAERVEG